MAVRSGCFGIFDANDGTCNGDASSADPNLKKPCEARGECILASKIANGKSWKEMNASEKQDLEAKLASAKKPAERERTPVATPKREAAPAKNDTLDELEKELGGLGVGEEAAPAVAPEAPVAPVKGKRGRKPKVVDNADPAVSEPTPVAPAIEDKVEEAAPVDIEATIGLMSKSLVAQFAIILDPVFQGLACDMVLDKVNISKLENGGACFSVANLMPYELNTIGRRIATAYLSEPNKINLATTVGGMEITQSTVKDGIKLILEAVSNAMAAVYGTEDKAKLKKEKKVKEEVAEEPKKKGPKAGAKKAGGKRGRPRGSKGK